MHFKNSYFVVTIIFFLVCANTAFTQIIEATLAPKLVRKHLRKDSLPFSKVTVIDSRKDTTLFYIAEHGSYPPISFTFKKGTAGAMQAYFDTAISVIPHGNNEIVIKLNYNRIPNKQYIQRRTRGRKDRILRHGHDRILLNTDVFLQEKDGLFKQIIHLEKRYPTSSYDLNWGIEYQYTDICKQICNYFDTASKVRTETVAVSDNAPSYTIASLAAIPFNSNIPIFFATLNSNGFFKNFDDFKENQLIEATIRLDSVSNAGVYHFNVSHEPAARSIKTKFAWAIVYNGICYIQMYDGSYLPLKKQDATFSFYIPQGMPDMYSMLCYENYWSSVSNGGSSVHGNSQSLLIIPALIAFEAIWYFSVDKPAANKIVKAGLAQNYRYCSIDMYSGDFLYSNNE